MLPYKIHTRKRNTWHALPSSPEEAKRPGSPSVHSINWDPLRHGRVWIHTPASGTLLKQARSKPFSVSMRDKHPWVCFIKTDIFIQQTHSETQTNFNSKPGGRRSWQRSINLPKSPFLQSCCPYGISPAVHAKYAKTTAAHRESEGGKCLGASWTVRQWKAPRWPLTQPGWG